MILAGATAATGMAGGTVLLSDNASASVSGEFSIPDESTVVAGETVQDVRLSCDAVFSYESNAAIHGVELELHVGATAEALDLIARYEDRDLGTDQLEGEETLSGSIMTASSFSVADFQPSNGDLSRSVVAELRFYVLRNEEVVAEAVKQDTFTVSVSDEELTVEATVGGTGEVSFTTG
jgi:hypothetical protein